MPNYKITIQYDGTNYAGWQFQPNNSTIQGEIELVLHKIIQEKVSIIGSGRTDAGVHALGQVANFAIDKEIDTYKTFNSINALLPKDIAISEIRKVSTDFHARYNACKRSYIYLLNNFKSPFYNRFAHRYNNINNLSVNKLNELSACLLGSHDFTSFSKRKTDTENKICTIKNIQWKRSKGFLIMLIEADRYLHGMVKTTVGTLIKSVEAGKNSEYILNVLHEKNREAAKEAFPSKGLFLYKVKY